MKIKKDDFIVDGYIGKWHVIGKDYYQGEVVYLLEHSTYGNETQGLIVNKDLQVLLNDVWNGFSDLED